jgi:hypothetical protein
VINFKALAREGLAAAQTSINANNEIDEVLNALCVDLNQLVSGAQVEISTGIPKVPLETSSRRVPTSTSSLGQPFAVISALAEAAKVSWVETTEALILNGEGQRWTLCEIERSSNGYPLILRYADLEITCRDKSILRSVLGQMLKHAGTGRKLMPFVTRGQSTPQSASQ